MCEPSNAGLDEDLRADVLRYRLERQNAAQSYNGEMSKWILASLILINGSPFLLASKEIPGYTRVLANDAWYFISGISLAILCGFCAWLNTGMREAVSGYEVEKLIDALQKARPTLRQKTAAFLVNFAYLAALATGFSSLVFFIVGTNSLARDYLGEKSPPTAQISTDH